MFERIAADVVLVVHLAFVVFVVAGALLVIRYPKLAWLHVPAAVWGVFIELTGRICPLTTLENHLLRQAGLEGYSGSFIQEYIIPVLYPPGLTRNIQYVLAAIVAVINLAAYGWIIYRTYRARRVANDA